MALAAAVLCFATLAAPAVALGANQFGLTFAGQAKCMECHSMTAGPYAAGTYATTAHSLFVQDVAANPKALQPATNTAFWPSPAFGGGISFAPADILWQTGHPGQVHEFVSKFRNDADHLLSTGYTAKKVAGPADDWLLFDPLNFSPADNIWELESPVKTATYFQGCGGCHNLGITRPSNKTYTLPSGAVMSPSTETSYSGLSIQCENCHGTGESGAANHFNTGTEIVRTKRVLESEICGQCHTTMQSKQTNWKSTDATPTYFSNPNGYTADEKLSDYMDVYGAVVSGTYSPINFVWQSPYDPKPVIPLTSATKFYPDGHNKSGGHFYYNEWLLTPHSRSLHWPNGMLWTEGTDATPTDDCLRCHSGEGFLKRTSYAADVNPFPDVARFDSNLAEDTLDIECAVCHTAHARTADGEALGLRLPADELCAACHTAELPEGAEAAPGSTPHHPQKEMFEGYGLIGVPTPAEAFMPDAECIDCHMPWSNRTGNRISHSFMPMTPGKAMAWNLPAAAKDSCTPCHAGSTRTYLQSKLDTWSADLAAAAQAATQTIAAAKTSPASATPAGQALIAAAQTNVAFVLNDSSKGAHNYPYAMAGLEKAASMARAVGAKFSRFSATGFDAYHGMAVTYGRLLNLDGTPAANEEVTIEALPGGAPAWTVLGTVRTDANGDFMYAVAPTFTTYYRAAFTPIAGSGIYSGNAAVYFYTSTSIARSPSSVRRYRYITVYGSVSPNHAGSAVLVSYKQPGRGWRALGWAGIDAAGNYRLSVKARYRGYYYFTSQFYGDPSHVGSASGTVRVKCY